MKVVAAVAALTPVSVDGPAEPKVSRTLPAVAEFDSTSEVVPPPLTIVVLAGMPGPLTLWPLKVAVKTAGTVIVELPSSRALTWSAVVP